MAAKVDSALLQDGYQIYHHSFFFSKSGAWAVVQQGMNTQSVTARRYHWYSKNIKDLVCEPHSGIAAQLKHKSTLDLTSRKSTKSRNVSRDLVSQSYQTLEKDIKLIRKHSSEFSKMVTLENGEGKLTLLELSDIHFRHHPFELENFFESRYLKKILTKLCDVKPASFENLLSTEGVGPKTVRALSLVAEIIYGAKPSFEDPARYSFAHGGKDFIPYPVDRPTYDQTIQILKNAVAKSRINPTEKDKIYRRLNPKI